MIYNWQLGGWPEFVYELEDVQDSIFRFAEETGEVNGMLKGLSAELQQQTLLELMLAEAIKTSEIEGDFLNQDDVLSSIRNNLGLNAVQVQVKDQRAAGVAQLMVEVRRVFAAPLSIKTLLEWHGMLMAGATHVRAGHWRTGAEPMQVVSGAYGRETVHFEAPPSSIVGQEMERYISWYNHAAFPVKNKLAEAVIKSAVAHLYFESIHPFEDGNGRIGRAIAEKALSQCLERPVMLSLSKAIARNKNAYYSALKAAQRTLVITDWIKYFASVVIEAQLDAKQMIHFTLKKAIFFDSFKDKLSDRQLKALRKMMDQGAGGFEGGMTARKYASINKTSKATATRDLQELHLLRALVQEGAGRSVRYHLNLDADSIPDGGTQQSESRGAKR